MFAAVVVSPKKEREQEKQAHVAVFAARAQMLRKADKSDACIENMALRSFQIVVLVGFFNIFFKRFVK